MQKIRNLEELQNEIDSDLAWRKKEIADFHSLCRFNNNPPCLIRACFVMVCAHFEGAIKFSSNAYIDFISGQSINGTDLKPEINAIAVRKKRHHSFAHTGVEKVKVSVVTEVLKEYDSLLNGTFCIRTSNESEPALPTGGNPTPDVLKEMTKVLGLNYNALFEAREKFINSELLNPRHSIAHGGQRPITDEALEEVANFVLSKIDAYASAIMEAAMNDIHLRVNDNSA